MFRIAYRLLGPSAASDAPGLHPGCEVGGEMRSGVGCVPRLSIGYETNVAPSGGAMTRRYPLPAFLGHRRATLQLGWRPVGSTDWRFLPARETRTDEPALTVTFEPETESAVDLRASLYLFDPPSRPRKTTVVLVPAGAVLSGGFALEDLRSVGSSGAGRFRIGVHHRGGREWLLDRTLDGEDPAGSHWVDYRLPLDAFAGRRVRFVFDARPATTPARPAERPVPVWSEAVVLAPEADPRARNVVLVSVDTLRADHLGVYGADLATSPRLDRFANEATLFERAVTTYPTTTAAHASMLTGVYPSTHHAWDVVSTLSSAVPLLSERLAADGYRTLAVTEDAMLSYKVGFRRGFSRFREFRAAENGVTPGFVVEGVTTALEWIAQHRDERFFLFLHTYAVHGPHTPPAEYDVFRTYRDERGVEAPIAADTPGPIRQRHLYAGEILFADHELGRLLDGIRTLSDPQRTIVLVTADHGEAFDGRHGGVSHGFTLAEEVLHVPLLLWAPGLVPSGRRVGPPVSLVDVTPTLLDLLGLPVPAQVQGRSLVPALRDPIPEDLLQRPVFSELRRDGHQQWAIHQGHHKWIVGSTPWSGEQLYDLAADPEELRPLRTAAVWGRRNELLAGFARDVLWARGKPESTSRLAPDPETADRLRALGYVQ